VYVMCRLASNILSGIHQQFVRIPADKICLSVTYSDWLVVTMNVELRAMCVYVCVCVCVRLFVGTAGCGFNITLYSAPHICLYRLTFNVFKTS
jgi:hypothetical protein